MADYTVWYDNDTKQEHQLYSGNTLLTPPLWACGLKFTNPSYYSHLDNYYGTLESADFYKDVYVWVAKPGCPATNESFIEYVDGSDSFPPIIGATGIQIFTNYGAKWVDENGSWPYYCAACIPKPKLTIEQQHPWETGFAEIATLKSTLLKKQVIKFDSAVDKVDQLLTSLKKAMISSVREADKVRTRSDSDRLANIEEDAIDKLVLAQKQIDQCVLLAGKRGYRDSAYRYCDLALNNLQESKSLWMSRD
jgi:hypothetical protein